MMSHLASLRLNVLRSEMEAMILSSFQGPSVDGSARRKKIVYKTLKHLILASHKL